MDLNEPRHNQYREVLRQTYTDDLVTSDELADLARLRQQLGLTEAEHDLLLEQVRPSREAIAQLAATSNFEGLIPLLGNPDAQLRSAAIAAVRGMGARRVVDRLLGILESHDDPWVQRGAAAVLADLAVLKAKRVFYGVLESPNKFLRREAARGLANIVENHGDGEAANISAHFLNDKDPVVRSNAIKALRYMISRNESQVAHQLVQHIDDGNSFVRKHALDLFENMGEAALEPIVNQGLNVDDFDTRRAAMDAVGRVRSDKGLPYLIQGLSHPDHMMRWIAIKGLARFRQAEAVEGLLTALEDRHPHVRRRAAHSLASHGPEVIPRLLQQLATASPRSRRGLAGALALMDTAESDAALMELLPSGDPEVQCIAIKGLVAHRQVEALAALQALKGNPVEKVALAAINGARRLEEMMPEPEPEPEPAEVAAAEA